MPAKPIVIASEPRHVFHALLHSGDLSAWWGCTVVVDARVGGVWVGGWGEDPDRLGHGTVLSAQITQLEPDKLLALKIGDTEIVFHIDNAPQGAAVRVGRTDGDTTIEDTGLESWVAAVESLKVWVEQAHPYVPPAQPTAPATAPAPATPSPAASQAPAGIEGDPGVDPYAGAGANGTTVIDEGGFGVTDPKAVIKSWSKEQGFGYATHAQLGDVSFDYDGCDFEPSVGDQVLLLVIGKRYDGKPKVKRIACPAKGSNIR